MTEAELVSIPFSSGRALVLLFDLVTMTQVGKFQSLFRQVGHCYIYAQCAFSGSGYVSIPFSSGRALLLVKVFDRAAEEIGFQSLFRQVGHCYVVDGVKYAKTPAFQSLFRQVGHCYPFACAMHVRDSSRLISLMLRGPEDIFRKPPSREHQR